jgi:hypothetical protein
VTHSTRTPTHTHPQPKEPEQQSEKALDPDLNTFFTRKFARHLGEVVKIFCKHTLPEIAARYATSEAIGSLQQLQTLELEFVWLGNTHKAALSGVAARTPLGGDPITILTLGNADGLINLKFPGGHRATVAAVEVKSTSTLATMKTRSAAMVRARARACGLE